MGLRAHLSDDRRAAVVFRNPGAIRAQSNGGRWSAVLFNKVMFVSIYLPGSTITDAVDVSSVTLQSVSLCRRWRASKFGRFSTIVALDAN
eukprot:1976039-Pyramimonas_sp.AAC.1